MRPLRPCAAGAGVWVLATGRVVAVSPSGSHGGPWSFARSMSGSCRHVQRTSPGSLAPAAQGRRAPGERRGPARGCTAPGYSQARMQPRKLVERTRFRVRGRLRLRLRLGLGGVGRWIRLLEGGAHSATPTTLKPMDRAAVASWVSCVSRVSSPRFSRMKRAVARWMASSVPSGTGKVSPARDSTGSVMG